MYRSASLRRQHKPRTDREIRNLRGQGLRLLGLGGNLEFTVYGLECKFQILGLRGQRNRVHEGVLGFQDLRVVVAFDSALSYRV